MDSQMKRFAISFLFAASVSSSALAGGQAGVGAIDWRNSSESREFSQNIAELIDVKADFQSSLSFSTANSTPATNILTPQEALERIENLLAVAELIDIAISTGLMVVPGGAQVYGLSKTVSLYVEAAFFYDSPSVLQAAHAAALSTALSFVSVSGGGNALVAELIGAGIHGATARSAVDELLD